MMILGDLNTARVNQPGQNLSVDARLPIQGFSYIQSAFPGGFLDYHAFQAKLERKFSNGFYFLNSFTWSKAIDNASGHLEAQNGDNSRVNYENLAAEKGLSGYDQPFNNVTTFLYDLPFGQGRRFGSGWNKATDLVAGGWRLSAINFAGSGTLVNLSWGPSAQFQVSGAPTYRPNISRQPARARRAAVGSALARLRRCLHPHRPPLPLRQRGSQHRPRTLAPPDELRPPQRLLHHRKVQDRISHGSLQLL
jgi:hypothetical protein